MMLVREQVVFWSLGETIFPGAITSMGEEMLQHYQNHLFLGYGIVMLYIVDIQSFKRDG